ncbi:MAG: beta-propeller domain-containing protein, partial [Actinomycetia bacterium]|nr:beta-propeller domain-containing protein [Actinomycetes bacterium]
KDGVVYLITTHHLENRPVKGDPRTFVPSLFRDTEETAMDSRDIIMPENPASTSYIVVTSISTETGEHLDGKTLFGYDSIVYMSLDNLFIAQSNYEEYRIDSHSDSRYDAEYIYEGNTTHLVRFSIDQGALNFRNESVVPGELLNQFSIDQYQDTVRVVTTITGSERTRYYDSSGSPIYDDTLSRAAQTNALFVLDLDGNVIGKITDLAPNETVKSVRFAGDIGYFVTFRQTDPLFAVDLSNPKAPRVLSALKIPGFSRYLHVYGPGLLFGLGLDVDEYTDRTETIKLSMFDTSDPRDVRELDTFITDIYYSEALFDHKAILVLPSLDLIGFPADNGYMLFGYDEYGFYQRPTARIDEAFNARGVLIDDHLYVCSPSGITVLNLESLRPIATLEF